MAMHVQGERSDELFGMMMEPYEPEGGESPLSDGSEEEGGGAEDAMEGTEKEAEKDAQLDKEYEEARQEGFQGHGDVMEVAGEEAETESCRVYEEARRRGLPGAMPMEEMNALEEEAMPVLAGLSMELDSKGEATVQPKGAGSSGELPKTGSGDKGLSGELLKTGSGSKGLSDELPETGSANGGDEDGEGDRATGERQEARGGSWTEGIEKAIKQQVEAWRRGEMTPTVDMLELRNGKGYAMSEVLSMMDGKGNQISWAQAMVRLQKTAEKGKLGVVLDAMNAVWDTRGPIPVLAEWLLNVWHGHADAEEDALVEMEEGDDVGKQAEAKRARDSTPCKFGQEREELS